MSLIHSEEASCRADECVGTGQQDPPQPSVRPPRSVCASAATATSRRAGLYRSTGSAQAYKPQAPRKSTVCAAPHGSDSLRHKVAHGPLLRTSTRTPTPSLTLEVTLLHCDTNPNTQDCECRPLPPYHNASQDAYLDVWQARPDGTYSSLRRNVEEGDCRARVEVTHGTATLHTLPPGSTGALGGLGPGGWDAPPFAPPVLHLLAVAPQYQYTLVHVPIWYERRTLQPRTDSWRDWRGHGWMQQGRTEEKDSAFRIVNWDANVQANHIHIQLHLFLTKRKDSDMESLETALCPAALYGTPWTFFNEPIAVCAPTLLDFFAL